MDIPKLKDIDISDMYDSHVLHIALFNVCKDLVGTDPTWAPHVHFKQRYQEAQEQYKAMMDNPCALGYIIGHNNEGQELRSLVRKKPTQEQLVGLHEQSALDLLKEGNCDYRVVSRDGIHYIITMDLCMGRFNLTIENGLVVDVDMY